ncbi:hypothetical protein D1864_00285 [Oceanobacillus picturae]|nr:hypothetical protein D1864_00285 [Oceanobacillus picturae]
MPVLTQDGSFFTGRSFDSELFAFLVSSYERQKLGYFANRLAIKKTCRLVSTRGLVALIPGG